MKKYVYKTKEGKPVYSDVPLDDKELTLVFQIKGGLLKRPDLVVKTK